MHRFVVAAAAALAATLALGLWSASAYARNCPKPPEFERGDFQGDEIDNRYSPLKPGTTYRYEGESAGADAVDIFRVTNNTKKILGVKTTVIRDRFYEDGELVEDTQDWFAQDKEGNLWYFGEDTKELEDGEVVSTEGSWQAGVDGAKPGIFMPADPEVGEVFKQEHAKGVAEDCIEILDLNASVETPYVDSNEAMKVEEFTRLEPGVIGHKWFVPDVGMVREQDPEGFLELVSVTQS
jgi:hypothetical protein